MEWCPSKKNPEKKQTRQKSNKKRKDGKTIPDRIAPPERLNSKSRDENSQGQTPREHLEKKRQAVRSGLRQKPPGCNPQPKKKSAGEESQDGCDNHSKEKENCCAGANPPAWKRRNHSSRKGSHDPILDSQNDRLFSLLFHLIRHHTSDILSSRAATSAKSCFLARVIRTPTVETGRSR